MKKLLFLILLTSALNKAHAQVDPIPEPPQTWPPAPFSYYLGGATACNCDEYGQKSIIFSTSAPEGVNIEDFENQQWEFVPFQQVSINFPVPEGKCVTVTFWLVNDNGLYQQSPGFYGYSNVVRTDAHEEDCEN